MKTKTSITGIILSIIYISIVATIAYGSNNYNSIKEIPKQKVIILMEKTEIPLEHKSIPKKVLDDRVPNDESKRCPEWENKFKEYGLPVDVFSYIAWRESNCNPKAINARFDKNGNVIWTLNKNGSIDRGLVQINSSWKTVTKNVCGTNLNGLLNIDCNLSVAKYIMENSKGKLLNWNIQN